MKEFLNSWVVKLVVAVGLAYCAWRWGGDFYSWIKAEAPFWRDEIKELKK